MKLKKLCIIFILLNCIEIILSCKKKPIDPIDKFIGFYLNAIFSKNIIHNNESLSTIEIKKKDENRINLKASNIFYKRTISPNGGYEDTYKDFEVENCEIVNLDTLGINNSFNSPFIKIININNKKEIGKISNWEAYPNGVKTKYLKIELDYILEDSIKITGNFYKWAEQ